MGNSLYTCSHLIYYFNHTHYLLKPSIIKYLTLILVNVLRKAPTFGHLPFKKLG